MHRQNPERLAEMTEATIDVAYVGEADRQALLESLLVIEPRERFKPWPETR
jgi:hypothetical protein